MFTGFRHRFGRHLLPPLNLRLQIHPHQRGGINARDCPVLGNVSVRHDGLGG